MLPSRGASPRSRRILRWVNHVDHGKEDRRQTRINAEFVDGGTVGPAPESRSLGV